MTTHDPRLALEELIAAFRAHFDLAQSDVDTDSDEFLDAEERLANAFFTYDDLLFTQLEVELPFEILDDDELDEDDLDDEDDLEDLDDDDEDDLEQDSLDESDEDEDFDDLDDDLDDDELDEDDAEFDDFDDDDDDLEELR